MLNLELYTQLYFLTHAVNSFHNNCIGYSDVCSYHIVLTQGAHCSQNAVIGYQCRCPHTSRLSLHSVSFPKSVNCTLHTRHRVSICLFNLVTATTSNPLPLSLQICTQVLLFVCSIFLAVYFRGLCNPFHSTTLKIKHRHCKGPIVYCLWVQSVASRLLKVLLVVQVPRSVMRRCMQLCGGLLGGSLHQNVTLIYKTESDSHVYHKARGF